MKRPLVVITGFIILLFLWFWAENKDYFRTDFKDLNSKEKSIFEFVPDPTKIYVSYFGDKSYTFPRQDVNKVKLFRNTPFIGSLKSKTLKEDFNRDLVDFFNDSSNFSWGETTWSLKDSEYILKFYNDEKIVGKVYLCLDGCGMIETRPFTPNVKFGGLSKAGQSKLESMIGDDHMWD